MKIKVKELKTNKTYEIECEMNETAKQLMERIQEKSGIPAGEMKLIMG